MEFDIKRVYTAVNADKLKIGSICIFADTIETLKALVKYDDDKYSVLRAVLDECQECRFKSENDIDFMLAYFISEPEEKKLKCTDLRIGDLISNDEQVFMVTGIDATGDQDYHIFAGNIWISDTELKEWKKVNLS